MNPLQGFSWSPFADIDNDELINLFSFSNFIKYDLNSLNKLKFNQFSNNHDHHIADMDPDHNFFSQNCTVIDECKYYFHEDFLRIDKKTKNNSLG